MDESSGRWQQEEALWKSSQSHRTQVGLDAPSSQESSWKPTGNTEGRIQHLALLFRIQAEPTGLFLFLPWHGKPAEGIGREPWEHEGS